MGASKGVNVGQIDAPTVKEASSELLPGVDILKQRMAGDRLNDLGAIDSLAEESSKTKYSGDQFSKAPTSQYLGQSSRPVV